MKKFFPIKTATACQLKWNWSTLYLYAGSTASCHRTGGGKITPETFDTFHNTEKKQQERRRMLQGLWPEQSCGYCRKIEESGGSSDRILHLTMPNQSPVELELDPTAVVVQPTILEVFFNNQCNLACVYCRPDYSSKINQEYKKFGTFEKNGIVLKSIDIDVNYNEMLKQFWIWMHKHSSGLVRLNLAGGEGFYQPEFETCLDYFESTNHPNLEFVIITNLMIVPEKLERIVQRFKNLVKVRKLKRIELLCSIDCVGTEQEYARYGISVDKWILNFERLLQEPWLTLNIQSTITLLTLKTMPELIEKLKVWRLKHKVGHYFGALTEPSYLIPNILGHQVFDKDFDNILLAMAENTKDDLNAKTYMQGIASNYRQSQPNPAEMIKLKTFLDENDRRRGSNWPSTFPWLAKELQHVV
jgi:hypothetical protein